MDLNNGTYIFYGVVNSIYYLFRTTNQVLHYIFMCLSTQYTFKISANKYDNFWFVLLHPPLDRKPWLYSPDLTNDYDLSCLLLLLLS